MLLAILTLVLLIIFHEYRKHVYIIQDGNIIFKNLTNSYTLESLIRDLIKNKVNDIRNIEKAYLFFGYLIIKTNRPLVLIANGKLDYEAIIKSKKSVSFIYHLLKEKSLKLSEILYAIYINDRIYIVKN